MRGWMRVPGRVMRSEYRKANLDSKNSRNARANSYVLDMHYEYYVDGKAYRSRKPLMFGLYTLDDIQAFVEQYPAGASATVYVNPRRHDLAVLDPRVLGKGGRHELGFAVILFVLAAIPFLIRYKVLLSWWGA